MKADYFNLRSILPLHSDQERNRSSYSSFQKATGDPIAQQNNHSSNSVGSVQEKGLNFFNQYNSQKLISNIILNRYLEINLIEQKQNPFDQIQQISIDPLEFNQQPMILLVNTKQDNKAKKDCLRYTLTSVLIDKHIILSANWRIEDYIKSTFDQGLIDIFEEQSYQSNCQEIENILRYCLEKNVQFFNTNLKDMIIINEKRMPVKQTSIKFIFKRFSKSIVYGFQLCQVKSLNYDIYDFREDLKLHIKMKLKLRKKSYHKKQQSKSNMYWSKMIETKSSNSNYIFNNMSCPSKRHLGIGEEEKKRLKQCSYRLLENNQESKVEIYIQFKE